MVCQHRRAQKSEFYALVPMFVAGRKHVMHAGMDQNMVIIPFSWVIMHFL